MLKVPIWCRRGQTGTDHRTCCYCGYYNDEHYQFGDGRFLHTLCKNCYWRIIEKKGAKK
jgi:ribosomal protein L32